MLDLIVSRAPLAGITPATGSTPTLAFCRFNVRGLTSASGIWGIPNPDSTGLAPPEQQRCPGYSRELLSS